MKFDHNHYVPCLQWKQGEYLAISGLSKTAQKFVTPLIEVPEIGFDFETWSESKTIDEHLEPFSKRVRTKWGTNPCFVDVWRISFKLMQDGQHPISFVFDRLRNARCSAVPVTGIARSSPHQQAVKRAVTKDGRGLCVRLTIEEAAKPNLKMEAGNLVAMLGVDVEDCDLILDLGAPNFSPVEGFTKLVESLIRRLPYWFGGERSVSLGLPFHQRWRKSNEARKLSRDGNGFYIRGLLPFYSRVRFGCRRLGITASITRTLSQWTCAS